MKTFNLLINKYIPGFFMLRITTSFSCQKKDESVSRLKAINPLTLAAGDTTTMPITVDEGLIAYWPLICSSGYDLSGNGHNGTLHNIQATDDRSYHAGGAMHFNGNSGYPSIKDDTALRLGNTDFTVNAWIKPATYSSGASSAILDKRLMGSSTGWTWGLGGDAYTPPHVLTYGAGSAAAGGNNVITTGTWHMVTTIYHLSTQKLSMYVDGVLDKTTLNVAPPDAANTALLYIGRDKPQLTDNGYFNGAMNDIRLYQRAITGNEMQQLYTPPTAPSEDLVAYFPLSGTGMDITGNNPGGFNHGALAAANRLGNPRGGYNTSNGYLQTADDTTLRLSNTDFSVNAWIKLTSYNDVDNRLGSFILYKANYGAKVENDGWGMMVTSSTNDYGSHKISFGPSTDDGYEEVGNTTISLNTWHMVTVVFHLSTKNMSFFLDGVLDDTQHSALSPSGIIDAPLTIGNAVIRGTSYPFNGSISNIRIYRQSLSGPAIQRLYEALN